MANYISLSNKAGWQNRISRNELILQSIGEGVCVVDKENMISFANPSAAKMLGWNLEELISQHYEQSLFGKDEKTRQTDIEEITCPIQFAILEGEATHVNTETFYRRDRTKFLVEYTCVPLRENNEIVGAVITFQDISERIDLEYAVARARDAALESAQEKANFLANMSHEIRTPLNGIIGISELLSETNLSIGQRDYLETLKTSANLLLNIVNDILDLSKIEAGKLELEETDFNLREIVGKTIKLFTPQAFKKHIELHSEIEDTIETELCGDAGRLRQVLHNLIGNALKFTEAGEVHLKISSLKKNFLQFEVSDTGIGIEKDKQQKIFEPFSQAEISITRQFGGTGLGLAIARQIVQMMDGEIGVESEPGKGSKFWFTAKFSQPVLAQTSAILSCTNGSFQADASKVNILVVDDNLINQKVTLGKLRQFSLTADAVENGLKAVKAVREKKYDLVLMDCRMPQMDGYEATREIRRLDNEAKNVKIVAMTGSVGANESQKCFAAGMDDYLAKPITIDVLLETLSKHLSLTISTDGLIPESNSLQHPLAQIIDSTTLNSFIEIEQRGEKNFAKEMLNLYIKHSETQIAEIETAVAEHQNWEFVKNKSHMMRGSSGNIGLPDFCQDFADLEKSTENDWVEAERILNKILEKFIKLKIKISHLSKIGD